MKTKIKNKKEITGSERVQTSHKKDVVRKNMTFAEIFEKKPEAIGVLFESGLHCVGCGMAQSETLEQGCLAHGMTKKQIDFLVKKINISHEHKFSGKIKRRKPEVSS